MARKRNFQAEYQRRIENAAKRGLTRSQARGHARTGEATARSIGIQDRERLEKALNLYRNNRSQAATAKAFGIAPERLRRFIKENVAVEGRGKSLKIIDRRPREMMVISKGEIAQRILLDRDQASLNGRHLAAVQAFVRSNDIELLSPFEGRSVIDAKGKSHPLETNPNTLHRLAAAGSELFHEVYRLVI